MLAHSFLCSFQRAFSINISFILTLRRIVHGNKYPKLLIPLAQAHHTSGREENPPAQACKLKSRALSFSVGGREGEKRKGGTNTSISWRCYLITSSNPNQVSKYSVSFKGTRRIAQLNSEVPFPPLFKIPPKIVDIFMFSENVIGDF